MADVVIIGAGITGLTCAWRLKSLGIEAMILESSGRPGGVIQTEKVGEYLVEWGPNSLLPSAENFPLLDESGLTGQLIAGDPKAPRYICIDRKLRKVPFGPMSFGGMSRAAGEIFIRSTSPRNESVRDFFQRRFGTDVEARLVSPFVTGIYAGNTSELSMAATFPTLVELERKYGSVILGMMRSRKPKGTRRMGTCSFVEGMESLPRRLSSDAHITYDCHNVRVTRQLNVSWSAGEVRARAVVVTVPAYRALAMLEESLPEIARLLEKVEYAPIVIAASSFAESAFAEPLRGFGFLVPRSEKLHLLGTLFSSSLFSGRAPVGRALLTSFLGGAHEPDIIDWPDDRVWSVVQSELPEILRTKDQPDPVRLIRRRHGIPQYKIGHDGWTASLKNELKLAPGLFLAGNYADGISVSACMITGERVARETSSFIGSRS